MWGHGGALFAAISGAVYCRPGPCGSGHQAKNTGAEVSQATDKGRAKGTAQGKAWGKNERLKGLNVCE